MNRQITRDPGWLGVMKLSLGVVITHPEIAQDTVDQCAGLENSLVAWLQAARADGRLAFERAELVSRVLKSMILGAFTWPASIQGPMDEAEAEALKQELVETFLVRYRTKTGSGQ